MNPATRRPGRRPARHPGRGRAGRLAPAATLAVVVTALLALAGCTAGHAGQGTVSPSGGRSVTGAPQGAPGATTAGGVAPGTDGGSGAAGGTSDTGPAGTAGTAARAASGASNDPQIPPVAYRTDPAEAALEKALPGMYGLDSLGASVHGTTVSVGAAADCAFVLEVIEAGQWRVQDLQQSTKSDPRLTAVLHNGNRSALLSLSLASSDYCRGTIVSPSKADFGVSGAVHESGRALLYPLMCSIVPGTGGLAEFAYLTGHGSYLLGVQFPDTVGTATSKGSDAGFLFYRAATTPDLGSVIAAQRAANSPTAQQSDDGSIPGWKRSGTFQPSAATTETVSLTSVAPVAGTVTIAGAANVGAPSTTVTIRAGFSCGS